MWLGTQSCHYLNFEQDVLARAMNKPEVNFFLLEIGEFVIDILSKSTFVSHFLAIYQYILSSASSTVVWGMTTLVPS